MTRTRLADTDRNVARTRDYDAALRPFSRDGGYVNFMATDDQVMVDANYRHNHDRLRAAQRPYDPENLLRCNHNIMP